MSDIREIQTPNVLSVTIQSIEDPAKLKEIIETPSVAKFVMVCIAEKKNHVLFAEILS